MPRTSLVIAARAEGLVWDSAEAVAERALVASQLRAWPMPAYMVPERPRPHDDARAAAMLVYWMTVSMLDI